MLAPHPGGGGGAEDAEEPGPGGSPRPGSPDIGAPRGPLRSSRASRAAPAFPLCRLPGGILRNPDDAKDVVQETFLRALRGLRGFRGAASARTGLARIA